ncbi:MAG: alpha/beta fold hydrolase BchO [Tateyamaria sp.]|uniref:alpha/beta fold hydrolase BchO n=1 Tax=Tateyamaria sp. TaxID=1929288 RepID=UPI003281698E
MDWVQIKSWPNAELSRRIQGPVHRWHVQEAGQGKTMLLLHGAGGSAHNFRDMIKPLAMQFHVVAVDLPGQGFTQLGARHRCGLQAMAQDVLALCAQEGWTPEIIVGHSAGGAIALDIATQVMSPRGQSPFVIGINAALGEFPGLAGLLFPLMAKALAAVPFTARLFSGASANPERIKALIASTGSELDPQGLDLYRRLVADRDHVDATLLMMAQWKLQPLLEKLGAYTGPVRFIVGEKDATVPPTVSLGIAQKMQDATVTNLPDLGHLVHEEQPQQMAALIIQMVKEYEAAQRPS